MDIDVPVMSVPVSVPEMCVLDVMVTLQGTEKAYGWVMGSNRAPTRRWLLTDYQHRFRRSGAAILKVGRWNCLHANKTAGGGTVSDVLMEYTLKPIWWNEEVSRTGMLDWEALARHQVGIFGFLMYIWFDWQGGRASELPLLHLIY